MAGGNSVECGAGACACAGVHVRPLPGTAAPGAPCDGAQGAESGWAGFEAAMVMEANREDRSASMAACCEGGGATPAWLLAKPWMTLEEEREG